MSRKAQDGTVENKTWTFSTGSLVQVLLWLVSMVFAASTYFHTQATVNAEVGKLKEESDLHAKILCTMAIDLKTPKANDICTREIFNRRQ